MIFSEAPLRGAFLIDIERRQDERGFFARSWCREEFAARGLDENLAQCNISFNRKKGTLRGMHYQLPPFTEAKVVRCTKGALYDVIIDLRPESPTFLQWYGVELSGVNYRMLYVPHFFAHGFLTLVDETEVSYQMSAGYAPDFARGIRWNDNRVGIVWPIVPTTVTTRDGSWPDVDETQLQNTLMASARRAERHCEW